MISAADRVPESNDIHVATGTGFSPGGVTIAPTEAQNESAIVMRSRKIRTAGLHGVLSSRESHASLLPGGVPDLRADRSFSPACS